MNEEFLQTAIELAYQNALANKGPYGAVVVRDGEIVGVGVNEVVETNDPTAHAEIQAIREACKKLGTVDLSDCEIYASSEPCPMCMATIMWTGAKAVYYSYPKDPDDSNVGAAYIYKQLCLPFDERDIPVRQVENKNPEMNPFA